MKSRHLIDSAVFDIGFGSEETAFELQSELNGFINKQLMTVVAEVFDASSHGDTLLRIPVIELDLGAVAYTDYRDELPRRLREKLVEQLAEIRQSIGNQSAANSQSLDRHTSRRELVEYFLLHGHLPWYASQAQDETIEQLLIHQLASEPQALSSFLQATAHKQLVVDRLVAQFKQQTVHSVIQLLAPNHAARIKQLSEQFLRLWRRYDSPVAKRMHAGELGHRLWSSLIMVLLGKGSRQLSPEQLFENALLALLPELTVDIDPFVNQLERLGNNKVDTIGLKSVLSRLTKKQSSENTPEEADKKTSSKLDGEVRLIQLRQQLVETIISGDFPSIKTFWEELLADHAPLLQQALRQYGQQALIRERIAHGFPEPVLQQILVLIEPVECSFVSKVLDRPELFQSHNDRAVSASVPAQSKVRKQLWQFSLGYLLVERGSYFNKKSYLGSLVRQMAMANNLGHAEMLAGLTGHVAGLSESNAMARQLLQLLTQLRQEAITDTKIKTSKTEMQEISQWRGYELYDELVIALSQSGNVVQADLIKTIAELEQNAPWLLMRLLRELQSGRFVRGLLATHLSIPQLRHLVLALLRLSNQGETSSPSDLINAIEDYSGQSTDLKQYYHQILDCLLQGELIDFDAILTGSDSVDSRPVVEAVTAKKSAKKPQTPVCEYDEQALIQYLHSHDSLTDSEAASLIMGFEYMLDQHPQSLRRTLTGHIADKGMVARLLSLLPERLLSRSLSFMGMRDMQRLQQYAEIITTACHTHELSLDSQRLTDLKWQLLFAYLKDVGPLFNEQRFVEYFLTGLASLIDLDEQSDGHSFSAVVSQQLVLNSLPSTRDITQKIVQCLAETTDHPIQLKKEATVSEIKLEEQPELEELPLEDIHISNAGMVLAAPYLPRLFEMLGLTEKSAFKDSQAAVRGVHMLQFLVDENTDCPEYQLVLNKLLCGVKTAVPIERQISLKGHEKERLQGLLTGMIQNWKSLGNTSIAGLRESFLQRQGRLQLRDDAWHLLVEAKPYDMLLDQLPWSYSTIKYPWMERVIYVDWR